MDFLVLSISEANSKISKTRGIPLTIRNYREQSHRKTIQQTGRVRKILTSSGKAVVFPDVSLNK
jgi:hypothetical protein